MKQLFVFLFLSLSLFALEADKPLPLQDKNFKKIRMDRSENDWIRCFIEDKVFKGAGGPFNLPEILQIFRAWAEEIQ